jgi:UDPglucose 6-dehydrogenase
MISIIGLGFVGGAMKRSFELKGKKVIAYDKYKQLNTFEDTLNAIIIFLCLPTVFDKKTNSYDKEPIYDTCNRLEENKYSGLIVIKSTVEPETINKLSACYPTLKFVHNPEFLTAITAFEDFHNQKHIVIGKSTNVSNKDIEPLVELYTELYPEAEISVSSSIESESMKIFVNCFYATKIQFFNELYLTCKANNCNYDNVRNLMLKNGWINKMHTNVPGPDGKLSYGGYCFPKDTNALLQYMNNNGVDGDVLNAVINERNKLRDDNTNIKS